MKCKFKICTDDAGWVESFIIEADTIEEVQQLAQAEVDNRHWVNYWSEEL